MAKISVLPSSSSSPLQLAVLLLLLWTCCNSVYGTSYFRPQNRRTNIEKYIRHKQAFLVFEKPFLEHSATPDADLREHAWNVTTLYWLCPPLVQYDERSNRGAAAESVVASALEFVGDPSAVLNANAVQTELSTEGFATVWNDALGYYDSVMVDEGDYSTYRWAEAGAPYASIVEMEPNGFVGGVKAKWYFDSAGVPELEQMEEALGRKATPEACHEQYEYLSAAAGSGGAPPSDDDEEESGSEEEEEEEENEFSEEEGGCKTIDEILCGDDGSTPVLCDLLREHGISLPEGGVPHTVFAPLDYAFSDELMAATATVFTADQTTSVLLYHVAEGELRSGDLSCGGAIPMLSSGPSRTQCVATKGGGPPQLVQKGGGNAANGVYPVIVEPDVAACDGVIHYVSEVMLPNWVPPIF